MGDFYEKVFGSLLCSGDDGFGVNEFCFCGKEGQPATPIENSRVYPKDLAKDLKYSTRL